MDGGEKGARDKDTKMRSPERGSGTLSWRGRSNSVWTSVQSSQVPSYATADRTGPT